MAAVDFVLVDRVAVGLKVGDEGLEARSKDDEIAGAWTGDVGMGSAGWDEDGSARAGDFGAAGVAEGEFAFEHVPGFVVGVVNVEGGRAAAAPLVNGE